MRFTMGINDEATSPSKHSDAEFPPSRPTGKAERAHAPVRSRSYLETVDVIHPRNS